ncbi:hypothetical protein LMG7974_01293 [Campylobacter majalis]|uniref:Uncharacterized protein n=1 Tax=Campylobacter majalis TaxID=2790656 RepID=A0ABM8Q876_9BACT|nr:hypothetical protein [Campylobacter majalis]CAD7289004.1 hypothetical protein LMG7974_01293 [Campylobacter majalis]
MHHKDKGRKHIKQYTEDEFLKTYDLNSSINLSKDYTINWDEKRCEKIKIYTNYGEFDIDSLLLPFDADWIAKTNQQNE